MDTDNTDMVQDTERSMSMLFVSVFYAHVRVRIYVLIHVHVRVHVDVHVRVHDPVQFVNSKCDFVMLL